MDHFTKPKQSNSSSRYQRPPVVLGLLAINKPQAKAPVAGRKSRVCLTTGFVEANTVGAYVGQGRVRRGGSEGMKLAFLSFPCSCFFCILGLCGFEWFGFALLDSILLVLLQLQ